MKLRWLFILLITPFPLSAQQSEDVFLKTDSAEIAGTLTLPDEQNEPCPVVLIIAGSGPTDRNGNNPSMVNNSLKMLAEGLASHGIASLRFDKRGVGASSTQKTEIDLRFEDFVQDVEALYNHLKEDKRFSEIHIVGHSEGSLIGMIVAHKVGASGFISVAGAGFPAADILRKQFGNQPKMVTDVVYPFLDSLEAAKTVEVLSPFLQSTFRASIQPYLISWFQYDPRVEIAKLECPVLIIQGTTDIQVGVEDAESLAESNTKTSLSILEGMNHVLKEAEIDRMKNIQTYSMPDLPLKEGLVDILVEFLRNTSN